MPERISRDAYGLKLAEAAALRADCSRRQVGAVILDSDGRVVSTGYNGRASGLPGCASEGACPRGKLSYADQPAGVGYAETSCDAAHAEANALLYAGRDRTVGQTLYVTDEPCHGCQVLIMAAGIARVVTPRNLNVAWTDEEVAAEVQRREETARIRAAIAEPPEWPGPTVNTVATRIHLDGFREDRYSFLRPEDWDTE